MGVHRRQPRAESRIDQGEGTDHNRRRYEALGRKLTK